MSLKLITALALAVGLSACATVDTSTRNAPLELPTLQASDSGTEIRRDYNLMDVVVVVPESLRASESNAYYPVADIVWRGDAIGDRHAQVADLFKAAARDVASDLNGSQDVYVQITVARFHGVTERTRYSVGGVYNMVFDMTIVDGAGNIVEPTRRIEADLPAPGGQAALELEQSGQTEKVRVVDYLTFVLTRELSPALAVAPRV
ncbi:DUF6778 family protein [Flavimaricola marinus]|uniref:Lipoprotein n=1 Tax=Flavimaricola marinus TaxID=1819565 RepID=A0A238LJ08_9RHOB|nr:DUF6778 family protein [Flavimaricola marinus]SMY09669.1 hypothetical protein LOM8899_03841 [Flavimaricola marinus]